MSESGGMEVVLHPLLEMDIRPIQNWNEFLRRWKRAQRLNSFDEMMGLLHISSRVEMFGYGYNVKNPTELDRLLFYLYYADGWADKDLLKKLVTGLGVEKSYRLGYNPDKGIANNKTSAELRQMVAIKSADNLLATLFKTSRVEHKGITLSTGTELLLKPQIFSAILNFFRIEKGRYGDNLTIRNYPNKWDSPSHKQEKVRDFLISFSRLIWEWENTETPTWANDDELTSIKKCSEVIQAQLDTAKPWTIEVLSKLGEMRVLRAWLPLFDEACLVKLKEVAMRSSLNKYRHIVNDDRPVANIDEACFVGSPAAWLLKEHELVTRVENRLRVIREAEDAKAEADRDLQALTKH